MENKSCPLVTNCPIFINNVLINPESELSYKNIYCNAGEEKWLTCKRYMVKNITGKPVPENIMPNSLKSLEQIIEDFNNDTN